MMTRDRYKNPRGTQVLVLAMDKYKITGSFFFV